jgi:hypothetical protein
VAKLLVPPGEHLLVPHRRAPVVVRVPGVTERGRPRSGAGGGIGGAEECEGTGEGWSPRAGAPHAGPE